MHNYSTRLFLNRHPLGKIETTPHITRKIQNKPSFFFFFWREVKYYGNVTKICYVEKKKIFLASCEQSTCDVL